MSILQNHTTSAPAHFLVGNAIVGQSGGPTAAINATLAGVIRGVRAVRAVSTAGDGGEGGPVPHLYGMRNGVDGLLRGEWVDLDQRFDPARGGSEEALERLTLTPAAALGSCRRRLPAHGAEDWDQVMQQLFARLKALDIRYFFYIGGNDSMDTVEKVSAYAEEISYDLRVIGVPKTIDNDLVGTDHTPGFGSAAKYIAVTMQEILHDTAVYTLPAVTIVEIMGRGAGWLTAASALGRRVDGLGPDLVYLPERSFDSDAFYRDVSDALARHPQVVIAVAEGLRRADGRYVGEGTLETAADAFGHKNLAGTGKALEAAVRQTFGCKVRSIELNLPQRCAGHILSAQDIEESLAVGEAAVKQAVAGVSRVMMTIDRLPTPSYAYRIGYKDIRQIANMIKTVPEAFITPEGHQVTDACLDYLLPLIRGERYPAYRDGVPQYYRL